MAKRSIGNVISEARVILQDKIAPYRYTDTELVNIFNNALYEMKRLRPDAWLGSYGAEIPLYDETQFATEIPFPSIMFQATVFFIVGYAELRDDEFSADSRAIALLGAFGRQIASQGGGVI
jgi:hypothetical protein